MTDGERERLVTTGEAARALGISARTLQRYVHDGLVTPDVTLPRPQRPQYRWNIARLREQIKLLSTDHG
jgi:DNA-binding transcriptional MerR regulator